MVRSINSSTLVAPPFRANLGHKLLQRFIWLRTNQALAIAHKCRHHRGDWYDIGCPEDLARAKEAFAEHRERFLPADLETTTIR